MIVFTLMFGVLPRLHRLEVIGTLSLLLMTYLSVVGYTLGDKGLKSEICWRSEKLIEKQTGRKIKVLQFDHDGEYKN